ncbi:MAG: hypothetical protein ACRDIE_07945 [Chloroflexota bacterium]
MSRFSLDDHTSLALGEGAWSAFQPKEAVALALEGPVEAPGGQ